MNEIKMSEKPKRGRAKEVHNPVSDLWNVTLYYGKHPDFTPLTYAVRFQTKLIGGASNTYLVLGLNERIHEILTELNVYGVITRSELSKTIDYVNELKAQGIYTEVPRLMDVMNNDAESDESRELHQQVCDCVWDDIERYPLATTDDFTERSPGVLLNSEKYIQKFGRDVVALTSESLFDMLGLEMDSQNAKRLQEIARAWHRLGLLIKHNRQDRLQEQIRPRVSSKDTKRLYLLKFEGLFNKLNIAGKE